MTDLYQENWTALAPDGAEAFFFETVESTNTTALSLYKAGYALPLWAVGGQQLAGRGRSGRVWTSKTGNFYGSYIFRPQKTADQMSGLPFVVSLAVRDAVIACGLKAEVVQCKWPNDLIIGDKKASGILIESAIKSGPDTQGLMDYVIIGIGVNLAHYPVDAQFPATSLRTEGVDVGIRLFFEQLSKTLDDLLTLWDKHGFAPIHKLWSEVAWGIGEKRLIRTSKTCVMATVDGLAPDGGLQLTLEDGTQQLIYAGDVFPPSGGKID